MIRFPSTQDSFFQSPGFVSQFQYTGFVFPINRVSFSQSKVIRICLFPMHRLSFFQSTGFVSSSSTQCLFLQSTWVVFRVHRIRLFHSPGFVLRSPVYRVRVCSHLCSFSQFTWFVFPVHRVCFSSLQDSFSQHLSTQSTGFAFLDNRIRVSSLQDLFFPFPVYPSVRARMVWRGLRCPVAQENFSLH